MEDVLLNNLTQTVIVGTAAIGMTLSIISGGVGTVLGTIIGALLMTTIRTGCVLNGIPTPWTEIITGAIIVVAVIIDRLRNRKA